MFRDVSSVLSVHALLHPTCTRREYLHSLDSMLTVQLSKLQGLKSEIKEELSDARYVED